MASTSQPRRMPEDLKAALAANRKLKAAMKKKSRSKYGDNSARRMYAIEKGSKKGLSTIYSRDNARYQATFSSPQYQQQFKAWADGARDLRGYRQNPMPESGWWEIGRAGAMRKPESAHRHFVERYNPSLGQVMLVPYRLSSVKPDSKRLGARTASQKQKSVAAIKARKAANRAAKLASRREAKVARAYDRLRKRLQKGTATPNEGPSPQTATDPVALHRWAVNYLKSSTLKRKKKLASGGSIKFR